ncbi:MAG: hypothetical protein LBG65_07895 [Puniceicoccales bacterium]|jgi:hypothetical protein|nr:hypothetical protein [Puniceicoccales bacterium]
MKIHFAIKKWPAFPGAFLREKRRKATGACGKFGAACVCFLFSICLIPGTLGGDAREVDVEIGSAPLLCGPKSLFLAMNFLTGEADAGFDRLLSAFPGVEKKGSTLQELREYVRTHTKLYSDIRFCTDAEIAGFKDAMALVFTEGRPIAHVHLRRPAGTGIQVVDFPNYWNLPPAEFDREPKAVLLLSSVPIPSKKFPWHIPVLAMVFAVLAGFNIYSRRKR